MVTIENKARKVPPKGSCPHYLSIQNFTISSFSTIITVLLLKPSHPLLIAFYTLISYPFLTLLEHQPPSSSSYFPKITLFQRKSLSQENIHGHLPTKALLRMDNLLIPKPSLLLSIQIKDQFTKCGLLSRALFPQKKFL